MCKNVDDYIKRDFGDKGLCRDLRNPVGNDSIDHHACEYMAPASAVYAARASASGRVHRASSSCVIRGTSSSHICCASASGERIASTPVVIMVPAPVVE